MASESASMRAAVRGDLRELRRNSAALDPMCGYAAAERDDAKMLRALNDMGFKLGALEVNAAASGGCSNALRTLQNLGVPLNGVGLGQALAKGHYEIVAILLSERVDAPAR